MLKKNNNVILRVGHDRKTLPHLNALLKKKKKKDKPRSALERSINRKMVCRLKSSMEKGGTAQALLC